MTSPPVIRLESPLAEGVGLAVEFTWHEDRFEHDLYLFDDESRRALLTTPRDRSEYAVALVELHPQLDTAPQPTLFLHGAGGGAQWSMSVERGEPGELHFDVAARVLHPPLERALRYRREPNAHGYVIVTGPDTEVGTPDDGLDLVMESRTGGAACPTTLRWRYSVKRVLD
jgi:hypothetical protein